MFDALATWLGRGSGNLPPGLEILRHASESWSPSASSPYIVFSTSCTAAPIRRTRQYLGQRTVIDVLAAPNERRCIVRESLGYYNGLVVGGVYSFRGDANLQDARTFVPAVRRCVREHGPLSAVVVRGETEAPLYARVASLDLAQHIEIFDDHRAQSGIGDSADTELRQIECVLPRILDAPWSPGIPQWRLVVVPLAPPNPGGPEREDDCSRCYIAFTFAHSLGDGISGLAFHRTFSSAWRDQSTEGPAQDLMVSNLSTPFPEPFDTPARLPISWSYLLAPALGAYLPKAVAKTFGFRAAVGNITTSTWSATPAFIHASEHRTGVQIFEIDAEAVTEVVRQCRAHGAKLTGLLSQFIVRALSKSLPPGDRSDNFVSQYAIDMRGAVGISQQQMGLFVSGEVETHLRTISSDVHSEELWSAARSTTENLASTASRLQNQMIGLLRYVPNIRAWAAGKMSQTRDASFEISNLRIFDPPATGLACRVERVVFSQPTNAMGAPLAFNVASVKGDALTCAVSWQIGALGMCDEAAEKHFVNDVCTSVANDISCLMR